MPAMPLPVGRHPPLWVFATALVWAGLMLLLLSSGWLVAWLEARPSVDAFNLARLQAPRDKGLRVVALGTSKTRQALPFDGDFPVTRDAAGNALHFQRFSASKADFHILQPVLEALQVQPPDVLLLESDLLLYDRSPPHGQDRFEDFRQALQLIVRRVRAGLHRWLPQAAENYGADSWPTQSYCQASRAAPQQAGYARYAAGWRPASDARQHAYIAVLRRLQAQGTQVVLLDLPRAPHASELVSTALEQQVTGLRRQLQAQEGYAYWSPGVLADQLYCDQGHLTRNGRQVYARWLSQQLAAWLQTQAQP